MRGGVALVVALAVAGACGEPPEIEPSFVTPNGVRVWVYGRPVSPQLVEEAFEATLRELPGRWPEREARRAIAAASVVFLESDGYPLEGREVAGHVHPYTRWIYVAGGTRSLAETALVHEIVHYLDYTLTGDTDGSHESWAGEVFDAIDRVNGTLRARTGAVPGAS